MASAQPSGDSDVLARLSGDDVNDSPTNQPFLTVIMRTRGDREEPLRDALLCLASQTDQDFDVIIMVHNPLSSDAVDAIATWVVDEVPHLAPRVRTVASFGGTLSRPLNEAIDLATGSYLAFFDDDDLVLANWVSTFHDASERAKGRMIRSVIVDQGCLTETWSPGHVGLAASSPIHYAYPVRFSLLEHIVGGATPFHGFAFPRRVFQDFGLRFDDALGVHEDWELQLHAIERVGVYSCEVVTGIYRRHPDTDSLSTHPTHERDVIFDEMVRRLVDGTVFPIDGEELIRFRNRTKMVDVMWHQKEEVQAERDAEREIADARIEELQREVNRLGAIRPVARRLAGLVLLRLRRWGRPDETTSPT